MGNNAFLNATMYAKVFLLLLKNQLVAGRLVTGEFKDQVTDENGLSINIKRPPQFVAQDGADLKLQSAVTGSVPVSVDQYKNVHIDIGDLEYIQSYNQLLRDETVKAAASELAQTIDGSVNAAFVEFASGVGTPGVAIASPAQFNKVHTRLMDQSVPNVSLRSVVTFEDGELIRSSILATDLTGKDTNLNAMQRVRIPVLSEIDLYATQNTRSVVAGTRTNGAVNGAGQNVNYRAVKDVNPATGFANSQALIADGLGANATISRGDTFTVTGVNAVNNRSRQPLAYSKQFVVLEDVVATAGGAATLKISPPMIIPSSDGVGANPTLVNEAFQTVTAAPADNAVITWETTAGSITPVRAAFHKRAISLVSARLITPFSGTMASMTDPETGINIRYWRGSDITTGAHIHRWDCVYGVQMIQQELGARVNGS
tara:strand:+ start:9536 stop:10822 length:1287 start_codon:yes stop_codon:yes gene_type:complete